VGGDPVFFVELIDDFLVEAPAHLETVRTALSAGDADTARRAIHTLRGQSRMFGAHDLASVCEEMESATAAGDSGVTVERLAGLALEWDRVRLELLVLRNGT